VTLTQETRGLTDNASHVILHMLDPRFLTQTESHEVASIVCEAQPAGPLPHLVGHRRAVRPQLDRRRPHHLQRLLPGV
jgi:hypothetical protein